MTTSKTAPTETVIAIERNPVPETRPDRPGFDLVVTAGWIILFILFQIIGGIIAIAIAAQFDAANRPITELMGDPTFIAVPIVQGLIAGNVAMLALLWLYLRKGRADAIGLNRWSRLSLVRTLALAALLVVTGLALNYGYATYVIPDIKVQEALRQMFEALPKTMPNQVMLFLAVAVIAPVLEEIVFRGLLQHNLARLMPIWLAIPIAGTIFAGVHWDFYAFPALMAMGMIFGVLYHVTGSLRVTIIVHAVNNAAALLLTP